MSLAAPLRHAPAVRTRVESGVVPLPLLAATIALVALTTGRLVIGPGPTPLSYDAYATVAHFDRLMSGHGLEAALGTTPKPLLTVIFGAAHALGGWTAVEVASIGAWVVSAIVAAVLAARVGGVLAGLLFGWLVATSSALTLEAAWGLGTVWALGIWAAAGLAVTAQPPRWRVAGMLLGLATLVRVETLLVIGAWLAVLGARRLLGRRGAPRGALAGGLLALWCLPVMLLHDLRLSGDPLLWTHVSSDYGRALAAMHALPGPWEAAGLAMTVLIEAPIRTALAVLGAVVLARRGAWGLLTGLAALGPCVLIALPLLAVTDRLADTRYLEPARIVAGLTASVGAAWLAGRVAASGSSRRQAPDAPRSRYIAVGYVAVASAIGLVLLIDPLPAALDGSAKHTVERFHALGAAAEAALPALREVTSRTPAIAGLPPDRPLADRQRLDVFAVSGNLRARLALDLGIPLTRIVATDPAHFSVTANRPPPGEVVLHSAADEPAAVFTNVEVSEPTPIGPVLIVPLLADPATGTWVVRIDGTGGGPLTAPAAR